MKAKPKGPKYRNLYAGGGAIYYQRWVDGKRARVSCQTADWSEAAGFRDEYEAQEGIGRRGHVRPDREVPTLADFAERYLDEAVSDLATTTRKMRRSYLQPEGALLGVLGSKRLDEISLPVLTEWWFGAVTARKLARRTGRAYLDALQGVYRYATALGLVEESPVPRFRATLQHSARTKSARADAARDPRQPIETAEELARLLAAAATDGERTATELEESAAKHERNGRADLGQFQRATAAHARARSPMHEAFVLTLLDAGLRVGEALALTWGQIAWGEDQNDVARHILVDRNRPQGGAPEPPKSGRSRLVGLSRRLRSKLATLHEARFPAGSEGEDEAAVFQGLDPKNFLRREWRRICAEAGLAPRPLKDLRDTFASQLLTAGEHLAFVSAQLGHADSAVTAKHYARWTGGHIHRDSLRLEPGEVAADFLARIAPTIAPSGKRRLALVSPTSG